MTTSTEFAQVSLSPLTSCLDGNFDDVTSCPQGSTEDAAVSTNIASFSDLALKICYVLIGCIGLLGNTVVILVIFNYTTMRKKMTNIYIINQSLIDLVASVFILTLGLFEHDGRGMTAGNVLDELTCSLWLTRAPLWSVLMSSSYNLMALTVERYWEIVHPISHKIHFTRRKAILAMAFVWAFGPVYNIAYEVPTSRIIDGSCFPYAIWPNNTVQTLVGVLTVFLQYVLPIVVMGYAYSRMAVVLRSRVGPAPVAPVAPVPVAAAAPISGPAPFLSPAPVPAPVATAPVPAPARVPAPMAAAAPVLAEVTAAAPSAHPLGGAERPALPPVETPPPAGNRPQPPGPQGTKMSRYERARRNIIKTLVIVCCCFTFCWTWNEVYILLYFVGYPTDFTSPFYHFSVVAVFVNSCVNPFIYIAKYEEFQRGLKSLCRYTACGKIVPGSDLPATLDTKTRSNVSGTSALRGRQTDRY